MTRFLCRTLPVLLGTVAFVHTGCGPSTSQRSPASSTGAVPSAADGAGGVRAMAVAPPLGAAGSFGVVGSSTVTNTGPTVINGDLGLSPGTSVTGFPPGTVNGTIHVANPQAVAAQTAVTTAYNQLAGQACDINLTGINLGGLTLTPGVYCFSSSAQLTGNLTLNGLGNPGSVWVFQIGSTLTTGSGSSVSFINGGQACGAFWQVGSSATLGTNTTFRGNILALASITATTGATNNGALFAQNGAVTLDSNVVNVVGSCGSGPQASPTPFPGGSPPPVPTLPEVLTWGLLAILLASGAFILSRH